MSRRRNTHGGNIIYNKAPIMMRQLELLIGEAAFQAGMQEYLSAFAYENATWPDLIAILDQKTETDLGAWSGPSATPSFAASRLPGRPTTSTLRRPYQILR